MPALLPAQVNISIKRSLTGTSMSTPSPPSLDELVRLAEALPAGEQADFLVQACGPATPLHARVSEILQLRSSGGWWDENIELHPAEGSFNHNAGGTRIGPYRIVQSLGEGGMGEVVLAERADEQFSQRVAIKLVRRGITSRQVQGRLKLERQILANLDHPNIAKLLDGGTSPEGVPYIVMEYIDGVPIDQYCDEHRLTIEERLRLFQVVCSAVHYAHQNLIVHRDLKPSNILINAEGIPKLLDFGIAKVLDDRALGHTLAVTHVDHRLMTPDHASPEQVRGDTVTTASDTYVLGVLLYELLTGHKPFSVSDNRLSAVERAICELPPLPLSSLFDSGDTSAAHREMLQQTCEQRSSTPARLRRHLTGDLGNIVMTALRKEPERRYASVEHFSADLDRYLTNMPVAARGDTVSYRAGKFVQRHLFGVSVTALSILALIAFAAITAFQAKRIEHERVRAEQVAFFLTDLFERSDPGESRGNDITVREILDVAASRIPQELQGQPDTEASLLNTIGTVYTNLGAYDQAIAMLERSLSLRQNLHGDHDAEVAESKERLGEALIERGDLSKAEPLLQQALQTNLELFGERSLRFAAVLHSLGRLRQNQERFAESREFFEKSLGILNPQPDLYFDELTITLNDYAILLNYTGDVAAAQGLFERALALNQRRYGADHPETATAMHNLAVALEQQGKTRQALPYFVEALATRRKILGEQSPQYITALGSYGRCLRRMGELQEAERVLREAVTLVKKVRGGEHYLVGYSLLDLGLVLLDRGEPAEAERESREALKIFGATLPHNHLYVAAALRIIGLALIDQNQPGRAESPLREAIDIQEASVGKDSPQVAQTRAALGGALLAKGDYQRAAPLLVDSYPVVLATRGAEDAMTLRVRRWIELLYRQTGRAAR